MKVFTNEPLVTRKQRTGFWSTLAGVALMVGAIFVSQTPEQIFLAWLVSLAGLALALFGTYHINRWARRPVAHKTITQALEKLDSRHILANYFGVVPHLLLTPKGIVGIRVKRYEGPVHYDAATGKWRGKFSLGRLYMQGMTAEGLGDPVAEAEQSTARLRAWLPAEALEVPVATVVCFLSPNVPLSGDPPPLPIAGPATLRKTVQEQFANLPILPHDTYQRLSDLLDKAAMEKGLTARVPDRSRVIGVKGKGKRRMQERKR